jgi:extradiol dioxygenase family protein
MTGGVPPFHLAFPVRDLAATRAFYADLLGCAVGRESERWIDFDFFGHQITAHVVPPPPDASGPARNDVDGDRVPVPHFGAVLAWADWEALAERVRAAGHEFVIGPRVRFPGEVGEQGTFFLLDPAGNALEFKSFRDPARLFASS